MYDRYDRGLCLNYSDVEAAYPYAKLNRFALMSRTDRTNSGHVWVGSKYVYCNFQLIKSFKF